MSCPVVQDLHLAEEARFVYKKEENDAKPGESRSGCYRF